MTISEIKFLDGPQSRSKDLLFAINTLCQMIKWFRALHFVGPCITIFDSARFNEIMSTTSLPAKYHRLKFEEKFGPFKWLFESR